MAPLKKVFILTQFGKPHEWTERFIDHVQHLERFGWYWLIFTPNKLETRGNVEVVPMTTDQFNDLVEKKTGVKPNLFITQMGVPSIHISDFYVAAGKIFEDYLKGVDFLGVTNWDIVYGRLDRFVPDRALEECDVFTDDINIFNGIFSLLRNTEAVNNLFKEIPNWKEAFAIAPCPKCTGSGINHTLFGTDEYGMTEVLKKANKEGRVRYLYPTYYPLHSHDRLEQHVPSPKLEIQMNGSLWEKFKDTNPPNWIHAHHFSGREIAMFHFMMTKKWPLL